MMDLRLGDCLEVMKTIPNNSVDLVVTSPPYYNQREYSNWKCFDDYLYFIYVRLREIHRILKEGSVVCWNIGDDRDIDLPSFTSTKMAESGLKYQDTIIWEKPGILGARGSFIVEGLYYPYFKHEHIYIYSKGKFNKRMEKDAILLAQKNNSNIWKIKTSSDGFEHPAKFHPNLPSYCIQFYSSPGDMVLDPFLGSGTTGGVCKELKRNFIGI